MSTTAADPFTDTPPPGSPGDLREIVAKLAEFAQLQPSAGGPAPAGVNFLRDVPVTITAQLGHTVLPIGEILKLGPGSVVELAEAVHGPIQLTVRGVPFAMGEVVVVDDRFAIRIKALLPPRGGKAGG
jgi:flagellar motor switch protein FliN